MFKSIFSRIFWLNTTIILTVFAAFSCSYYIYMNRYVTQSKFNEIMNTSRYIGHIIVSGNNNNADREIKGVYSDFLRVYSYTINADIVITDDTGTVVTATNPDNAFCTDNILSQVLNGTVVKKKIRTSGDYSSYRMIFGIPIIYENIIIGSAVFDCDMDLMNERINHTLYLTALSAAAMIISAFIAVYIQSRRISRPIEMLSKAANDISQGRFIHVHTKEKGELGTLVGSFNSMSDSLKQLELMKSDFVSDVSHELRTPMTTISGFVQGILDKTIPPESEEKYLKIVLSEIHRLTRLINDMLDAANYSEGRHTFIMSHFDINKLINQTVFEFESRAKDKNMEFETTFTEEEMFVYAEEDSIKRVMVNLFDNALKFGNENSSVLVDTRYTDEKVIVKVGNYGKGIKKDELKNIFGRFYKSDKSRANKGGTGLGLYLVHSIIQGHDEEITVESNDIGGGTKYTEFTFSLKRSQ